MTFEITQHKDDEGRKMIADLTRGLEDVATEYASLNTKSPSQDLIAFGNRSYNLWQPFSDEDNYFLNLVFDPTCLSMRRGAYALLIAGSREDANLETAMRGDRNLCIAKERIKTNLREVMENPSGVIDTISWLKQAGSIMRDITNNDLSSMLGKPLSKLTIQLEADYNIFREDYDSEYNGTNRLYHWERRFREATY